MANDFTLLLASVLAAFAGGIGLALLVGRRRPALDPAAEGERELLVVESRDQAAAAAAEAAALGAELDAHREQLERSQVHIRTLEEQVASYLRQYAVSKDILRKELLQKNALLAELAAANVEVAALKGRVQELEIGQTGIRRPAAAPRG